MNGELMGFGNGLNSNPKTIKESDSTKPIPGTPPFTLAILFLWVTLLSVSVGAWITLLNGFGGNDLGKFNWFSIRYYGTSAIALGTGITTAALMGRWRYLGNNWLWQPGHILLLGIGFYELMTVLSIFGDLALLNQEAGNGLLRQRIYEIEGLVQHSGIVLILAVSLCLIRLTRFWQFVMGMIIFMNLLILIMVNPFELPISQIVSFDLLRGSTQVTRYVVPVSILMVAAWEILWHERRDWLHWGGVVIALLYYSAWMDFLSWF